MKNSSGSSLVETALYLYRWYVVVITLGDICWSYFIFDEEIISCVESLIDGVNQGSIHRGRHSPQNNLLARGGRAFVPFDHNIESTMMMRYTGTATPLSRREHDEVSNTLRMEKWLCFKSSNAITDFLYGR